MRRVSLTALLLLGGAVVLSGCTNTLRSLGIGKDDPAAEEAERLRLPPDLNAPGINDSMAVPRSARYSELQRGGLLADAGSNIKVQRAGGQRWLTIQAAPEQVWQWLQGYLKENGVAVARQEPRLGVIETEPLLHGAAVPRGVFAPRIKEPDAARVADVYLFRLEPGQQNGATEVYVAHRRSAASGDGDDTRWSLRPADPFLEAEMLRGFMVYLGMQQPDDLRRVAAAENDQPQASLEQADGRAELVLPDSFYDAWRRVGLAIDRLGFTVEDRNRAEGQYFIRYDPEAEQAKREKGFLESLAFWRDEPDRLSLYLIQLEQTDGRTMVRVANEAGEPAPADVAERILALLYEQLR